MLHWLRWPCPLLCSLTVCLDACLLCQCRLEAVAMEGVLEGGCKCKLVRHCSNQSEPTSTTW